MADKYHSIPLVSQETSPPLLHQDDCILRDDDRGLLNFIKAWYLFPLHAVASCGLVFVMLYCIDGENFKTGTPPDSFMERVPLYQTDVVSLVSLALVVLKLISSMALALIVWRLIFIFFDKDGLTLQEMCRMDSRRIPVFSRRTWLSIPVLILAWPSQLASPLATGSVAWQLVSVPGRTWNYTSVSVAGSGTGWNNLVAYTERRTQITLRAPALASIQMANGSVPQMRRTFTDHSDYPTNSILTEVLLPSFQMTSIDWVDEGTVDKTLKSGLSDNSGYLNISSTDSPMTTTRVGNVAILKNTTWPRSAKFPNPPETVTTDTVYVAILVNRIGLLNVDEFLECPPNSTVFGDLPSVQQHAVHYYYTSGKPFATSCYMFGKSTIRAGNYNCTASDQCVVTVSLQGNKVVALPNDPEEFHNREIKPDAPKETTFAFMPEVTANICAMNTTNLVMWNGIENYTRELLTLSYESTWSALTEVVQSNITNTQRVTVIPPEQLITADISKTKIYAWLAGNLALLASGLIVLSVQTWAVSDSPHVKAIRNTTLAALTIDINEAVDSMGGKGLCNAVELSKCDQELGLMTWNRAQRWHRALSAKHEHTEQDSFSLLPKV
ncbi:hypothetical protein KCU67_g6919, partial [Aureobasidium melanogenum]